VSAARKGLRVLAVSTDPAHSLGDAFGTRLTSRRVSIAVTPRRTLDALELDAPRVFRRWLGDHRLALGDALEHGTWLDRTDVDALLELPIPGVDELLAMLEIVRVSGIGAYDLVVIDTAPTGHTLRLLAAPETVGAASAVLDSLQHEHRAIRRQFARVARPEAADRLIELLAHDAAETGALLRDLRRTAFHWVMLPEALSLAESGDGLAALAAANIPVTEIVVNRVVPDGRSCPICDRRRAAERTVLRRVVRELARSRPVSVIHEKRPEPRGVKALAALTRMPFTRARQGRVGPVPRGAAFSAGHHSGTSLLEAIGPSTLVFFGGKGGVGKTTAAAAAALSLARATPGERVLLLSTDPAHSLGDVLAVEAADVPRAVHGAPSNLHVREVDAAAALAVRRTSLEAALREIVASVGGPDTSRQGVSDLLDLAPPGIDELFGMLSVVQAHGEYQRIVVDTAPTGHALRLLEMPDTARAWVQVLMRVLLKYREVVRAGQLASELVELSTSVRLLQDLLHDANRTAFVIVTRAAEVPRLETERLIARLRALHLATPAIVVNARTLAPGSCPRCRANALAARRQLVPLVRACRRITSGCVIIETPLAAPPPRGVAALARWARTWM
jgi:arsenite-transporting ATPase